ncbi:hypothetical protein [Clostridium hydrogeniformans]|uniref:hypothetical protein n=1 Tax=Clostridium hydrogeniformans TaxID=349933 RepID=UPI0012371FDD|nr:hypothetical protein [Clostridium hydrogeniformans]
MCNSGCSNQYKKCRFINCYRTCNEYLTKKCSKLNRYPYVCNGCSAATTCTAENNYYKAKVSDTKYKELLVSSREGLNITPKKLKKIDDIISPLIKGQLISYIFTHHKNKISFCERILRLLFL